MRPKIFINSQLGRAKKISTNLGSCDNEHNLKQFSKIKRGRKNYKIIIKKNVFLIIDANNKTTQDTLETTRKVMGDK